MSTSTTLETIIIEPEQTATHSIIWLHGLGADGNDFVPIAPELQIPANRPTRFIFPHAPVRPITINGGMPLRAWYDIKDLQNRSLEDRDGVVQSHSQVTQLINAELEKGIASNNIVLAGFSQGAAMALYSGLRFNQSLGGIIALSGYLPLAESLLTEKSTSNQNISLFLAHGTHDDVVPLQFNQMTRDFLNTLGYKPKWHEYPMGHQVCAQEIADISAWLR